MSTRNSINEPVTIGSCFSLKTLPQCWRNISFTWMHTLRGMIIWLMLVTIIVMLVWNGVMWLLSNTSIVSKKVRMLDDYQCRRSGSMCYKNYLSPQQVQNDDQLEKETTPAPVLTETFEGVNRARFYSI